MVRTIFSRVMWVGRATVFLVGLAMILALVFGVASSALSATGGNFILGKSNAARTVSKLTANIANPALQLANNSTGAAATALNLTVAPGQPPLKVNEAAGKATNLDADKLDGQDSGELAPRGYAQVRPTANSNDVVDFEPERSKGVIAVKRIAPSNSNPANDKNVYCFDLTFTPHTSAASPFLTNAAVVATATPDLDDPSNDMILSGCPAPYNDAAARTYAASPTADNDEIGFGIVFM